MSVFCVGIYISISRVTDNKHHVTDVVGGAVIGVVVAIFMVRDFRLYIYHPFLLTNIFESCSPVFSKL